MLRNKLILASLLGLGLTVNLYHTQRASAAISADNKAAPVATFPSATIGDKEELADLLVKMAAICAKVTEAGYTVAHVEVDRLVKGKIYSASRTLYAGNSYKVVDVFFGYCKCVYAYLFYCYTIGKNAHMMQNNSLASYNALLHGITVDGLYCNNSNFGVNRLYKLRNACQQPTTTYTHKYMRDLG